MDLNHIRTEFWKNKTKQEFLDYEKICFKYAFGVELTTIELEFWKRIIRECDSFIKNIRENRRNKS